MSNLLSEKEEALADRIAERLTSENPGAFVSRQACDDRYESIQKVIDHICALCQIELVGVIVTVVGIIATVILIALKG